jgi:hypothetical protein
MTTPADVLIAAAAGAFGVFIFRWITAIVRDARRGPAPRARECSRCAFWAKDRRTPGRVCTARAPLADAGGRTVWPQTIASDSCGDFVEGVRADAPEP